MSVVTVKPGTVAGSNHFAPTWNSTLARIVPVGALHTTTSSHLSSRFIRVSFFKLLMGQYLVGLAKTAHTAILMYPHIPCTKRMDQLGALLMTLSTTKNCARKLLWPWTGFTRKPSKLTTVLRGVFGMFGATSQDMRTSTLTTMDC
jgi:hypothetical protein